ncbi:MAG: hypothetical protein LCH95_13965 [Proteobacteria bacterium]|nr:hypothetical protein [Pseudomonadota bacterium]
MAETNTAPSKGIGLKAADRAAPITALGRALLKIAIAAATPPRRNT